MKIFDRFKDIIKGKYHITIFEFGTCEGVQTNEICTILKNSSKNFEYHAFEADPRIIPSFKRNNINNPEITLVTKAIGSKNGNVKFYLSKGEEQRPGYSRNVFYGSSSIRKPKETLEVWPNMEFDYTIVESIKFDTYYDKANVGIIDFVWADVQGAEIDLIEGGQKAFSNVRYFYTEYDERELYEGEIGLDQIIQKLPGRWSVVEKYEYDVLLKNDNLE